MIPALILLLLAVVAGIGICVSNFYWIRDQRAQMDYEDWVIEALKEELRRMDDQ